jgi:hypothetical protein
MHVLVNKYNLTSTGKNTIKMAPLDILTIITDKACRHLNANNIRG